MDKKRFTASNSQSPKHKAKSNPPTKPIIGKKEQGSKNESKHQGK